MVVKVYDPIIDFPYERPSASTS